jgi:hypothetical protein
MRKGQIMNEKWEIAEISTHGQCVVAQLRKSWQIAFLRFAQDETGKVVEIHFAAPGLAFALLDSLVADFNKESGPDRFKKWIMEKWIGNYLK